MEDITNFLKSAIADKPVAAQKAFSDAIQSRVDAALEDKYNEVAHSVFNSQDIEDNIEVEEPLEIDSIETELEVETEGNQDV